MLSSVAMKSLPRLRAFLALLLLLGLSIAALLSGFNSFRQWRQQTAAVRQKGDDLTHWAERLSALQDYLPPEGVIGYISERDLEGVPYNATDQGEEMAMSQYVLAPRILEEGAAREIVIANVGGMGVDEIQTRVKPLGLALQHEFGLGIYLFRKVEK
jgi:hypothetical protein